MFCLLFVFCFVFLFSDTLIITFMLSRAAQIFQDFKVVWEQVWVLVSPPMYEHCGLRWLQLGKYLLFKEFHAFCEQLLSLPPWGHLCRTGAAGGIVLLSRTGPSGWTSSSRMSLKVCCSGSQLCGKQVVIYRCFQRFPFCLGQSMTIPTLQNLVPFLTVCLSHTKGIVEMFQSYVSATENKTLLEYAVNLVSYLLPLRVDGSP